MITSSDGTIDDFRAQPGTVGSWLARQIAIESELRPTVAELVAAGYPQAEIHAAIVRILEQCYESPAT